MSYREIGCPAVPAAVPGTAGESGAAVGGEDAMSKTTTAHNDADGPGPASSQTGRRPRPDRRRERPAGTDPPAGCGDGVNTAARLDMRTELPVLVTCQQLQEQLGLTRAAAYRLMRQLGTIRFPGSWRVYVRREDVHRLIEESTTR